MTFKIGEKILVAVDLSDPSTLKEYTVSRVNKDTVQCNGTSELTFYTAFCWPIRVKEQLLEVMRTRAKLKAAYEDSIKLIYQLANKISNSEI